MSARSIRAPLLVGFLVLLAHGPALRAVDFHYDDGHSVVRNPRLGYLSNLPAFFVDPTLFGEHPADAMYRPLVLVAHALNRALTGEHAAGFVALNLALHLAAVLLVAGLLRQLGVNQRLAWAGATLFGLHPLQTEVVNYVSARSESIAVVGLLLGAYSFLRWRQAGSPRWLIGVALSQLVAVGGKEVGAVLPLLLLALGPWPPRSARDLKGPLVAAVALLPYLVFYRSLRGAVDLPSVRPWLAQAATQIKALVYYLRAAVTPVDLSPTPQFRLSPGPADPVVLLALLALASLALLLWHARGPRWSLTGGGSLTTGAWWWILCLLPTLAVPLNVLVNDHRPYGALFGGVLILCRTPFRLPAAVSRALVVALAAVLVPLCWQRATVWRTEVSLWQDAVREGPAVPAAHHNLGFAYHVRGRVQDARAQYERAVELDPDYARPLTNLGALYRENGDLDRAVAVLRRAVAADPGAVEAWNNLGLVYTAQGRLDRAVSSYQIALQSNADIADIWMNLGLALRDAGRSAQAFQALQRALQLDPSVRQRLGASP